MHDPLSYMPLAFTQTGSENSEIVLRLPAQICKMGVTVTITPVRQAGQDAPPSLARIGPAARAINDCVEAWVAHLRGKAKRDRTIHVFRRKIEECAKACGWLTAADVNLADAEAWLARKRAGEPGREVWSGTTADHATSILRRFGAYLFRSEGLPGNPLEHLEASGEQGGDGSRAITTDEVRAMIRTARERARGDNRQRADAGLYFAFLALTGLRDGEATKCRWCDLDLTGNPPALYTDPAWAKNRRKMRVCLNDEIRGLLLALRAKGGNPEDRVFASKPNQATWHKIRAAAGVELRDGRGRVASYHSLRKWFATALDATGASPGVVSRLLRHSKDLAQRKYIDTDPSAETSAVQRLPALTWGGGEKSVKSGLATVEDMGYIPAAKHEDETRMVAFNPQQGFETTGGDAESPRLAATADQTPLVVTQPPRAIGNDNALCKSALPDPAVLAAFLAYGETLRRLVEGGAS